MSETRDRPLSQPPSQPARDKTRFALRLNALSCVVFGLMFSLSSTGVGDYLGAFPDLWLIMIGVGLQLHAVHMVLASMRPSLRRIEVFYFTVGDLLWALGSTIILVASDLITTPHGVIATCLVAVLVLTLGAAQCWAFSIAHRV